VSVLIPVFNEEQHIPGVVGAMLSQDFRGSMEFVFIDGGSTDRTPEILGELSRADQRVRVLDNPKRQTAAGLNVGLRAARGRIIARMDAHTQYPSGYISQGVERLGHGDVAHVSGPAVPLAAGKWSRRVALGLSTRLGTGGARFRHEQDTEIEVDSGFAGLWERSTLDHHGGWDEGWPKNQDAELAARIRAAGGRLVCLPQLSAGYIPRDSLASLGRQYMQYGYYRAKTSFRHKGSMRLAHLLPPALTLMFATTLAPGRVGRLARAAVTCYGLALAGTAAGAVGRAGARDAACLPPVFLVMHLSWGLGFIAGSGRYGVARRRA
jgi:succinoglycan biosynthesis protein ExoA